MRIAYIGNFNLQNINASSKRVIGNCFAFKKKGHSVFCIGYGNNIKLLCSGLLFYGIYRGNNLRRTLCNGIKHISKILKEENVDLIILYGALFTEKANVRLLNWCKKNNIIVLYDHVDLLDINWHNPFRALIRKRNQKLLTNVVVPNCSGVICISSFLAKTYEERGIKTLVVPPLSISSASSLEYVFPDDKEIKLVYAGTTSDKRRPIKQWKDRLDLILLGLNNVTKSNTPLRKFHLDIYGMTKRRYLQMFPFFERKNAKTVVDELSNKITFHGFVSNEVVENNIKSSDFTVLIRDRKTSTMAGFPTKISESIGCGTPVLCNDTSDIMTYIINGKTGIIDDDFNMLFTKAFSLSNSDVYKMKNACRDNPFYYELFCDKIDNFLQLVDKLKKVHQ